MESFPNLGNTVSLLITFNLIPLLIKGSEKKALPSDQGLFKIQTDIFTEYHNNASANETRKTELWKADPVASIDNGIYANFRRDSKYIFDLANTVNEPLQYPFGWYPVSWGNSATGDLGVMPTWQTILVGTFRYWRISVFGETIQQQCMSIISVRNMMAS